jgi:hypothetical protein
MDKRGVNAFRSAPDFGVRGSYRANATNAGLRRAQLCGWSFAVDSWLPIRRAALCAIRQMYRDESDGSADPKGGLRYDLCRRFPDCASPQSPKCDIQCPAFGDADRRHFHEEKYFTPTVS